jgi:hypothetical protein
MSAVIQAEQYDGLGFAIVQNLEIFSFEIGDGLTLIIGRHNVQAHHLRVVFAEISWLTDRRLHRRVRKACRRE